MNDIKKGEIYQHYKGGRYFVEGVATNMHDGKQMVVYMSIDFGRLFVREYDDFCSEVELSGGQTVKRFARWEG